MIHVVTFFKLNISWQRKKRKRSHDDEDSTEGKKKRGRLSLGKTKLSMLKVISAL